MKQVRLTDFGTVTTECAFTPGKIECGKTAISLYDNLLRAALNTFATACAVVDKRGGLN